MLAHGSKWTKKSKTDGEKRYWGMQLTVTFPFHHSENSVWPSTAWAIPSASISSLSTTKPCLQISQYAGKLFGKDRYTYRWLNRLLTRFSRLSTTSILVVRPSTAMGAFLAWAISNKLYSNVCLACVANRSNSSIKKMIDLDVTPSCGVSPISAG